MARGGLIFGNSTYLSLVLLMVVMFNSVDCCL